MEQVRFKESPYKEFLIGIICGIFASREFWIMLFIMYISNYLSMEMPLRKSNVKR